MRCYTEAIDVIRFSIRSLTGLRAFGKSCLNYHIKRCMAPCQGSIDEQEYDEIINSVTMLLEGKQEALVDKLKQKMQKAAEELDFEWAAVIRNQIMALEKILERQKIVSNDMVDQDVIAMARGLDMACVQVFFVRKGKLIEREQFILKDTDGVILTSFVKCFMIMQHLFQNK